MPDPFAPEGLLPSVLRAIDRPGQAIRNVLRGDPRAALRQAAALGGDIIDAPLPGDWISDPTEKGDYVDFSELAGLEDQPWYIKTPVDIAGGIVTDPLSWVSFGASTAGKSMLRTGVPFTRGVEWMEMADPLTTVGKYADTYATKGAQAIDRAMPSRASNIGGATPVGAVEKGYTGAKQGIKRTMGWFDLTPEQKTRLAEASSEGQRSAKVWTEASRKAMEGLSDAERTALGDAFDALDWGTLGKADASAIKIIPGNLSQRVDHIANTYKLDSAKLQKAAQELDRIGQAQYAEGLRSNVFGANGTPPIDYLQRKFAQLPKDLVPSIDDMLPSGIPSAVKGRKLDTPADLADFLQNTPHAAYERDAGRRIIERAVQQGRLVERGAIGQHFAQAAGVPLSIASKHEREAVSRLIDDAAKADPDFAYLAKQMFEGMPPRGVVTDALAKINRVVKPAMVYGVVLPKMGSIVRNQIGMVWQAASTPGVKVSDMRGAWAALGDSLNDAYGHFFGLSRRAGDTLGKDMDLIDAAFANAGQTGAGADGVTAFLTSQGRNDLADAVRLGVMDGFVSSEDILRDLTRTAGKNKWQSLYDAPGVVFQGVEQRGRLAAYKSMRDSGMSPELAAQQTKEAFLDYRITGPENRTLRDVIPFAQFAAQSIRQQGRAIASKPVIGVTAAQLFQSGEEDPIYPWMEDKSRINLGLDEQGNPLWLTGLGLPIESLGMIPNISGDITDLSKSLREGALSSTQPLLKTAAAITTGRDPYFDSPFGSYEKLPVVGEAGMAGRVINAVAGTGLLEPAGYGMLRQAGAALDETKPGGARALDLLTGGKLVSVDPDRAEQLAIQDYLKGRPDIKTAQTFYKTEEDAEFSALMSQLRDAKARVKEKRDAAAAAGM